ncbi:MAG: enoyl-CoA hydratase-related protein [Bernardetiaceae bacterium]|jgi:2-(1,2-epoxy-1,2-dihydrophenyl)acetyl-CoA isomerase|nr:enoyl-CoA hydratase-related protein [Bernardetiaceae bacterium]
MPTETAAPEFLVSSQNAIKTFTFNIPAKVNPVTPGILAGLAQTLAQSRTDGTRVLILTGAGADFSAGADLSDGSTDPRTRGVTDYLRQHVNPVVLAMRESPFPIIAKVRGNCVGVGFNFALACDLIFAETNATFNQIFVRIGLAPDGGGTFFMPRLVGYQKAFELMATGAKISAEEGLEIGFVNHVFQDEGLDAAVQKMAERLAAGPSVAIAQIKAGLQVGVAGTLAQALDTEAVNQAHCFATEDFKEGVSAFLEKRRAVFKGK